MKKGIAGLTLVAAAFSATAQDRPLQVEELTAFNALHDAVVSPDGKHLVYGVTHKDANGKATSDDLYLRKLSSKTGTASPAEDMRLTSTKGSESNVIWAEDSTAIYFLSKRSGTQQVWKLSLYGGEANQITDLPVAIHGFKLSKDESTFVFAMDTYPDCPDLQCTVDRKKKTKETRKHTGQVYDKLMVRHWDTWEDELRTHLFVSHKEKGKLISKAVDVMSGWDTDAPAKPFSGMEEVAFSPDGKRLVFSAKKPGKDHAWTTNFDLFSVNVQSLATTNLTEKNLAWDSHPTFSEDGRFLAYMAMKKPGFEADRFGLMLHDLRTGETKEVAPLWDRSVRTLAFGPDNRSIYALAQDIGQVGIFEVSTSFGDVRKIFADGKVSHIDVRGQDVYMVRQTLSSPSDVYRVTKDGENLTQLTQVNAEKLKGIKMGEFQQFSFPGWNNETVYGFTVKPWNFEEGKQYPIAFLVHGGPQGSFSNSFHPRWNAQLWAAAGYGVVMIDFHGSVGYGQKFTDSISRDWGGKPLEDLQKGLAYITEKEKWLDRGRACALGGSYGGYMMNWIAGNWPDGFHCLVNHAGLFDMPSFYQSTEELWFPEHDLGGPYWNKEADYQKYNPAAFVKNWKTPMLVIHGLKDFRVPYAQGLGAYTALQRQNIPSRLVIYPDENHWILKRDNLIHWYGEVFRWMGEWTKEKE
ncbi:S9 family peptidase [Algicola sagamiensis]|uniref:S9 family peptidase n=1 Tax=Algicola sagamiensis TaxID=163869 RepID=UPI000367FDD1|nr:S9 family peptidase [Algicola sagamiensis]